MRIALAVVSLLASTASVLAQPVKSPSDVPAPPPASPLPAVGDALPLTGAPAWPKLDWMYSAPSAADAGGKIVLHWFCAAKVATCTEDLARVVTLKENARVYVIAYIHGTRAEAKKLDPIRETEGVGRGTVAFGRGVIALMKQLDLTGPATIVVGTDGKVAHVTTGGAPLDLDARDAKVTALSSAIREFVAVTDGPKQVKPDEKFRLALTIKLSPWLRFSKRTVPELTLTMPPDLTCDAAALRGDQLKVADQQMIGEVSCKGRKGVYEMRGTITFGYDNPGAGGTGLGTDGTTWKFEIKP